MAGERVRAREQTQNAVVGDRTAEDGPRDGCGQQGREEQRYVYPPALPAPPQRPREDEVTPVGLVRPVVASGPHVERLRQGRRGLGVVRMFKRVNEFQVREVGRDYREETCSCSSGSALLRADSSC